MSKVRSSQVHTYTTYPIIRVEYISGIFRKHDTAVVFYSIKVTTRRRFSRLILRYIDMCNNNTSSKKRKAYKQSPPPICQ